MIVEYCEHGNLRDFLRQHDSRNEGYERPNSERLIISERTLVSFARQVKAISYNKLEQYFTILELLPTKY